MKKVMTWFILTAVSFVGLNAQNNDVRRLEFEIGAGFNKAAEINGAKADIGAQLFLEIRLNIINSPFDVGLQTMIANFDRKNDLAGRDNTIRFRGSSITFVDYNFRRWKNIAPFAGLGLGFAAIDDDTISSPSFNWLDHTVYDRSFIFNPRIGVEFFNHLRITFEYKWMKSQYSFFGVSIGGVLGGGQKK